MKEEKLKALSDECVCMRVWFSLLVFSFLSLLPILG